MIKLNVPYRYKHDKHTVDIIFIHLDKDMFTYKNLHTGKLYEIADHVVNSWLKYMKPLTDEEKLELL